MMWREDDRIKAARLAPGWKEFHRACGRHDLFFDHPVKNGRKDPYEIVAFTVTPDFRQFEVARGRGAGPIDAVAAAYRAAERPVAESELAVLLGVVDDFDTLMDDDDFGSLM